MKLLLDTMSIIYLVQSPHLLASRARAAIEDRTNEVFVSLVSPLEMQIKVNIGKLNLGKPVADIIRNEISRLRLQLLPITLDHIDTLSGLPAHHKDPFDRLLIAQALHEGLTLVTDDRYIAKYAAPVLWK